MKHLFISIALFFLWPATVKAQKPGFISEINVVYGILPSFQLSDAYVRSQYKDTYVTGGFSATFKHKLTKISSLNATIVYEHESGKWKVGDGMFERTSITIAPEYSLIYNNLENGFLQFYLTAGLGIAYRHEPITYAPGAPRGGAIIGGVLVLADRISDNSRYQANVYLSPLGVHIGRKFGGFLEAGVGYKGVLCGGLFYKPS